MDRERIRCNTLALGIALGLSACGGGSNVKSTPPPVVDQTPLVVADALAVASGETLARPVMLGNGASLVNAGTIGGDVRMDPAGTNDVRLVAGGSIHGDLSFGSGAGSVLSLDGAAGTVQRYSQAVTGTTSFQGLLAKSGEGTWLLDNDDVGVLTGIDVDGGSLQIVDGGPSGFHGPSGGDISVNLRHGELVFNRSDDVNFTGWFHTQTWLGEDGVLVQAGTGKLTLPWGASGVRFIRIERGTLQFGADDQPYHDGATAVVENNGSLVFNRNEYFQCFCTISGTGSVIKNGSGLLFFEYPDAVTYTGDTTVNDGYLHAAIVPGDITVNAGGGVYALEIAGDLFNAGLVDASGIGGLDRRSGDRVEVAGNYQQATTGTLVVAFGSQMNVAGTAVLEGGTLELFSAKEGYVANAHTTVLTAAGGLTGTFDQVTYHAGMPYFFFTSINYDANSVWLETRLPDVTVAAAGDGVGYTPASMSSAERVQGAFDQLNERIATDNLAGVSGDFLRSAGRFQRAPSIKAAQASLRSLSGQLHAASAAMTFRVIDSGNQALSDHLDDVRDGHAGTGMWTQQLGSRGGMARTGFDGVDFQLNGWLVGNDYRIGGSGVAGFAFGQGSGNQQLGGLDRNDSHYTEGMVYAGLTGDHWYTQGRLGFGQVRQDVRRGLLLGRHLEGVSTRYGSRYQVAQAEGGLRFGTRDLRLTPFVSIEYARSERDAFAENGAGGFGLRSDAWSLARAQAAMGVRAARHWNFGGGRTLDFGAHAQWRRTLGTSGDRMEASFVGLQQWSPLLGIGLSGSSTVVGFGLDAQLSPRTALRFAYDHESGQYDSADGISAGLSVVF